MAASKPFRENWQTSIPFLKGIVDWMNGIGHVLNNISMTAGAPSKVMATKDGIKFVLPLGGADGITDMGGSWGFKIVAYKRGDEEEDNPFIPKPDEDGDNDGEPAPKSPLPRFSNLMRDGGGEGEEEEEEENPVYWVKVLGGPAQVLGGAEHVFADQVFEQPLANGTHIYVRYRITNSAGNAACSWDEGFLTWDPTDAEHSPFDQDYVAGRTLVFEIGVVGKWYENYVRQDRVGSIMAVATVNTSGVFIDPGYEEL